MEIKKSDDKNLESMRTTRFLLGLNIALALLLFALEFSVSDSTPTEKVVESMDIMSESDLQPITIMEEKVVILTEQKVEPPEKINIVEEEETVEQTEQPAEQTEEPADIWQETDIETPIAAEPPAIDLDNQPIDFRIVEELPQFPGGTSVFLKWLTKNLRYPAAAQRQKIEGKVLTQFIIEPDGSVTDIRIVQSLHPSCDNEARRVLALMPKWKAGIQDDKPCRTQVCLPIVFRR